MIGPILFGTFMYIAAGLLVAAFLLDEVKDADNYQFLGVAILWPLFFIKGALMLIKFMAKSVIGIAREIPWTRGPMSIYKIFKTGFRSLIFGIEYYDWAGQTRAYDGGIRELCRIDDIGWNEVEKNYTFNRETWEWVNNENGSRYIFQG